MFSRNVHVVFAGPSASHTTDNQQRKDGDTVSGSLRAGTELGSNGVYRTTVTDFKLRDVNSVVTKLIEEICVSDR